MLFPARTYRVDHTVVVGANVLDVRPLVHHDAEIGQTRVARDSGLSYHEHNGQTNTFDEKGLLDE